MRRYSINLFITGSNALILSVFLSGFIIGAYQYFELHQFGLLHVLGVESWWNVVLTIIFLDAVTYFWHRAYHQIPMMWRMHRVHHSDLDLDVTSSGRFHLAEMLLSAVFRLIVIALMGASFASVVIFEIIFGVLNQLEHANVHFPKPIETWLRRVIVTPDMHRIHHSQEKTHTNSNYSTIFSWWDRIFGTYRFGENQELLVIGLPEYANRSDVNLDKVLIMPFGPSCELAQQVQAEGV